MSGKLVTLDKFPYKMGQRITLGFLPPEILILNIFQQLSFSDLLSMAATSRLWRKLVMNSKDIWRTRLFCKTIPSDAFNFNAFIHYFLLRILGPVARSGISKVNLDYTNILPNTVKLILLRCPELSELSLRWCQNISVQSIITLFDDLPRRLGDRKLSLRKLDLQLKSYESMSELQLTLIEKAIASCSPDNTHVILNYRRCSKCTTPCNFTGYLKCHLCKLPMMSCKPCNESFACKNCPYYVCNECRETLNIKRNQDEWGESGPSALCQLCFAGQCPECHSLIRRSEPDTQLSEILLTCDMCDRISCILSCEAGECDICYQTKCSECTTWEVCCSCTIRTCGCMELLCCSTCDERQCEDCAVGWFNCAYCPKTRCVTCFEDVTLMDDIDGICQVCGTTFCSQCCNGEDVCANCTIQGKLLVA